MFSVLRPIDCAGPADLSMLASFKVKIATLLRAEEVMRDVRVCDLVNWARLRMRACFCMSVVGSSDLLSFIRWRMARLIYRSNRWSVTHSLVESHEASFFYAGDTFTVVECVLGHEYLIPSGEIH